MKTNCKIGPPARRTIFTSFGQNTAELYDKPVSEPFSVYFGQNLGWNHAILYIYCPVWRETWRFVQPTKFMSPEGEARGRHGFSGLNKSSCLPTNWAINCLLYRKLKENFLSGEHSITLNRSFVYFGLSFSVSDTWRAKHVLWRHSPGRHSKVPWDTTGRHDVWRETRRFVLPPRDCSRPIIFLYSSYQFYEV